MESPLNRYFHNLTELNIIKQYFIMQRVFSHYRLKLPTNESRAAHSPLVENN